MRLYLPLLLALMPQQKTAAPDAVWPFAMVTNVYPTQAGCGIFKFWGAVDFAHDGIIERVYRECSGAENLPSLGARCSVKSHVGIIDALPADGRKTPFEGRIIDTMTCDPPIARPDGFT